METDFLYLTWIDSLDKKIKKNTSIRQVTKEYERLAK